MIMFKAIDDISTQSLTSLVHTATGYRSARVCTEYILGSSQWLNPCSVGAPCTPWYILRIWNRQKPPHPATMYSVQSAVVYSSTSPGVAS